ncbi:hypothetical protein BAE44_0018472, partial [Dichanthelium oligosanthes]
MKALQTLSCGGTAKSSVNFIEEISKHDNLRELELYCDAIETPGNKKRVRFPAHRFQSVKKLCIRQSSPLLTFEPNALPTVQVLELRFQKGPALESSGVSGVENLSSLKRVLLEFEQHDAGIMVTVDAVRNAAQRILPDHQYITIKVDGKSYGAMSGMVDALPGKLGALLEQVDALLPGASADVAFLQAELDSMCADIHHYESLERPASLAETWIGRVRELAYNIEDWVDLLAILAAASCGPPTSTSSRTLGWFRRGADKVTTLPFRHVVANELEDIKERVIELSKQRECYFVRPLANAKHRPVNPRMPAFYAEAGSPVGLDGQVEELSKILMDAGSREL